VNTHYGKTNFVWLVAGTLAFLTTSGWAQGPAPAVGRQKPLAGLQSGATPWTRGLDGLTERLDAVGLPAMPAEAFVQHIHQHLTILIHGDSTTIPAMIGINEMARYIAPIHTHKTDGIIHIEAATKDTFNLGQFFDVWGVRLTSKCVGGYCTSGLDSLRVMVNNQQFRGGPRSVPLKDHEEIQITFGTASTTKAASSSSLRKGSQPSKDEPK